MRRRTRGVVRRRQEDLTDCVPAQMRNDIFTWSIGTLKDALKFILVCTDWTAVATELEVHNVICVSGDGATDHGVLALLRRYRNMTSLQLVRCPNVTQNIWNGIRALPKCQELTIQQCNTLNVAGGLPRAVLNQTLAINDSDTLVSLNISANNFFTQEMVCSLLDLLPRLRSLDMSNSTVACMPRIEEDDARAMTGRLTNTLASLTSLTDLSMGYKGITDACLNRISRGRLCNLRTFRLMDFNEEDCSFRGVAPILIANPGLTHVGLTMYRAANLYPALPDDEGDPEFPDAEAEWNDQRDFEALLLSLPLVTLELPHLGITEGFLVEICSVPTLEALHIPCSHLIGTAEEAMIGRIIVQGQMHADADADTERGRPGGSLRILNMHGICDMTVQDISLLDALPQLQELNISYCDGIDPLPSFDRLRNHIQVLGLRGLDCVSDTPIINMLDTMLQLRELDISECNNLHHPWTADRFSALSRVHFIMKNTSLQTWAAQLQAPNIDCAVVDDNENSLSIYYQNEI
jgi:hypothetical protein